MNYKAIIFDFFGVISSEVAPFWFKKYFPEDQIDHLKEKYIIPADLGDISYDQFITQIGSLVGISPSDVKKEWKNRVAINNSVVSFIQEVQGSFKIGLLSDAPSEFLRALLRENVLENLFDAIVISSEVKITKRNEEIYKLILNKLEVDPPRAIFVDNDVNNIKIAESLGIKGYLYNADTDSIQDFVRTLNI